MWVADDRATKGMVPQKRSVLPCIAAQIVELVKFALLLYCCVTRIKNGTETEIFL
jgi:hypothetical protein